MDKKRISELALAIFIALIFLSSYISLTTYNSQQPQVTSQPQTAYAQSITNAVVTGYGGPLVFNLTCKNKTVQLLASNAISSYSAQLEDNNSVLNFYTSGGGTFVAPGNMSAYKIYQYITGKLNSDEKNCTATYGTAYMELPPILNMEVGSQSVQIPLTQSERNISFSSQINRTIGTRLNVRVSSLIDANGTIYGPISVVLLR